MRSPRVSWPVEMMAWALPWAHMVRMQPRAERARKGSFSRKRGAKSEREDGERRIEDGEDGGDERDCGLRVADCGLEEAGAAGLITDCILCNGHQSRRRRMKGRVTTMGLLSRPRTKKPSVAKYQGHGDLDLRCA